MVPNNRAGVTCADVGGIGGRAAGQAASVRRESSAQPSQPSQSPQREKASCSCWRRRIVDQNFERHLALAAGMMNIHSFTYFTTDSILMHEHFADKTLSLRTSTCHWILYNRVFLLYRQKGRSWQFILTHIVWIRELCRISARAPPAREFGWAAFHLECKMKSMWCTACIPWLAWWLHGVSLSKLSNNQCCLCGIWRGSCDFAAFAQEPSILSARWLCKRLLLIYPCMVSLLLRLYSSAHQPTDNG